MTEKNMIQNMRFTVVLMVSVIVVNEDVVTACSRKCRDENGCHGGGGGGGYGHRSYSRGGRCGGRGGGGGRGGCFDDTSLVWTKNETQPDKKAIQIMVKNLKEGDLVGSVDLKMQPKEAHKFMWTRATDVTTYTGHWNAHSFVFSNGNQLTVTSPHLMIIWKFEMSFLVRADEVKIGDEMIVNKMLTQVVKIRNYSIGTKVAIETEDGIIQVNDVLASGICEHNPDTIDTLVKTQPFVKTYKTRHFGENYNTMCMDVVAWKKAYMVNNGYSE